MSLRSALPVARPLETELRPHSRARGACLREGALAAALGLAAVSALVLLLWTISPHPDNGPTGALRIAADLWLLGHGVPLERTGAPGDTPAPIGVTPLVLAALPCWLVSRAVRVSIEPGTRTADGSRAALHIGLGYLPVAGCAVLLASEGPVRVVPWTALLLVPLAVFTIGLLSACCLTGVPVWYPRAKLLVDTGAPRAAAAGTAALCGAGALLAGLALIREAEAAGTAFVALADDASGRVGLLFLVCALAPNAAVWAAAYGLGPGFAIGTEAVRSPLLPAAGVDPALPVFPLLAAVPGGSAAPPPTEVLLLAALVPLSGALVTGVFIARAAVPVREDRQTATGWRTTAVAALLAAALVGAAMAALALLAGGPLGTGELTRFGPDPWLTGAAAFTWTAALGVPVALLVRARLLRAGRTKRRAARRTAPAADQSALSM